MTDDRIRLSAEEYKAYIRVARAANDYLLGRDSQYTMLRGGPDIREALLEAVQRLAEIDPKLFVDGVAEY